MVFGWFASVYTSVGVLAAGMLGKKSIIVVGGADVAGEKDLGYGIWLSPWKAAIVRKAIQSAWRVLVVDESLKKEILKRIDYPGENIEVLPTGHDSEFWRSSGPKEPLVLTVAAAENKARFLIKGIDVLLEVARLCPNVNFTLIGIDRTRMGGPELPANVNVVPVLSRKELLKYYQRAKVYCQPSRREGLSNTLCESMLCGCIPVGTDVGGTAHAVGETGIIVPPENPSALAEAIKKTLAMPAEVGLKSRDRIATLFPKQHREQRLRELISRPIE